MSLLSLQVAVLMIAKPMPKFFSDIVLPYVTINFILIVVAQDFIIYYYFLYYLEPSMSYTNPILTVFEDIIGES